MAHKVIVRGADDQGRIIFFAMTDDSSCFVPKAAMWLFEFPKQGWRCKVSGLEGGNQIFKTERQKNFDVLATRQASLLEKEIEKFDKWAEGKCVGLKDDLKEMEDQSKILKREVRQTSNPSDKLMLLLQARKLDTKRHEAWRLYDAAAKKIEIQKDELLNQMKECLRQQVSNDHLLSCQVRDCLRNMGQVG